MSCPATRDLLRLATRPRSMRCLRTPNTGVTLDRNLIPYASALCGRRCLTQATTVLCPTAFQSAWEASGDTYHVRRSKTFQAHPILGATQRLISFLKAVGSSLHAIDVPRPPAEPAAACNSP